MLNSVAQGFSFAFLLVGPLIFGLLGKPTEMGLSILAGALSLAFSNIDKISKFKGAGFEAEMREKVGAIIAKEAEPEKNDLTNGLTGKAFGLDENTRKVVKSLGSSQYTWRTVTGISQEAGLTKSEVTRSLHWLNLNGLVVKTESKVNANWGLSEDGRDLYNQIAATAAANA
ncbi:hypothetical protein [Aquipseudomonas alcaligenes]|uniref:hypothetical protein n=1 Tax=Aquipseudomonas alcaligenes TaxID=43263 RepID=UPI001F2CF279|nr:hypothetical protein [Pseudomonas alcaligenes]